MDFSKNLRRVRKEKKLTMKQVAERMGISQQAYSIYENKDVSPSLDTLYRLALALQVPVTDLVETDISLVNFNSLKESRLYNRDELVKLASSVVNDNIPHLNSRNLQKVIEFILDIYELQMYRDKDE